MLLQFPIMTRGWQCGISKERTFNLTTEIFKITVILSCSDTKSNIYDTI